MKYFIVNKYLHPQARKMLQQYGELLEFTSDGPPYFPICHHPDIFMCQVGQSLIVAPNAPVYFMKLLEQANIPFSIGVKEVGEYYPLTCHYNVVVSGSYLIHNLQQTDPKILSFATEQKRIRVRQGYTRCNCLALGSIYYLCSDMGIYKALQNAKSKVMYVDPASIQLKGMQHGFIGGCMGLDDCRVYVHGKLNMHPQGNAINIFLKAAGYHVVELYNSFLEDIGSIFVIDTN